MAKEKWETIYPGVVVKKHPTRKHGIKPDIYFTIRFQFNGTRKTSRLGWGSQGWTLDKAIVRMNELKADAEAGQGVATHREKVIKADEERQEQERQEIERQEQKEKDNLTVADYFNERYYPRAEKQKKTKTHQREESLFRTWIDPSMGKIPFKDVSRSDVEKIFHSIVDAGRSIRTAEYALTTLKQIWRDAKEDGYAGDMPAISKILKSKISKNDNARVRFLSYDEADLLLEALKERSVDLYEKTLISIHCGCRAGEIHGLTWGQVDQEHGVFNLKNTKSGKSRSVAMTEPVKETMQEKERGLPDELVYPGRKGKRSVAISATFQKEVDELFNQGVSDPREKVTFHTCRHTAASWMVMQGVSLYLVQKVLGHSTIQVTERYSHLAPDQLQLAANAIDLGLRQHRQGNIIPFKKRA